MRKVKKHSVLIKRDYKLYGVHVADLIIDGHEFTYVAFGGKQSLRLVSDTCEIGLEAFTDEDGLLELNDTLKILGVPFDSECITPELEKLQDMMNVLLTDHTLFNNLWGEQ